MLLALDVRVDRVGDGLVRALGLVLVDHRRPLAVVTHPGRQVPEPGAAPRRDVSGVAKIVEMQASHAERSDYDAAQAGYEQALLYQQAGSVLGEANCIHSLGDIAMRRSDDEGARTRFEQALQLYRAIREPFSIGWTLVRLARLAPAGSDRTRYWKAARETWASIDRNDLIESIGTEFQ